MAGAIFLLIIDVVVIAIILFFANMIGKDSAGLGLLLVVNAIIVGLFIAMMALASYQIEDEVNRCHEAGGQMYEARCVKSDIFVELE